MYIVLPLALVFAAVFVGAFIWAVRHGQMDDLKTPAARMLLDDDEHPKPRAGPRDEAPAEATAKKTANETANETASHDASGTV